MEEMTAKLKEGVDGFDPMSIFSASVGNNMDLAKQWMGAMSGFGSKGDTK